MRKPIRFPADGLSHVTVIPGSRTLYSPPVLLEFLFDFFSGKCAVTPTTLLVNAGKYSAVLSECEKNEIVRYLTIRWVVVIHTYGASLPVLCVSSQVVSLHARRHHLNPPTPA